jgi:hypothetical protein
MGTSGTFFPYPPQDQPGGTGESTHRRGPAPSQLRSRRPEAEFPGKIQSDGVLDF